MAVFCYLKIIPLPLESLLLIITIFYIYILLFRAHYFNSITIYAIILSPIFGSLKLVGTNILFSDCLVFFSFLVLVLKNRFTNNSTEYYLVLFLLFSHTFLHLLVSDLISIKPVISIIEIFLVYMLSKESVKKENINLILFSTIFATITGIVLMFIAFYQGINLNNFEGDSNALIVDAVDLDLQNYRMSFFYTNFPFIISSTLFILLYFVNLYQKKFIKLAILIIVLLISLALVASGNKTTMITTMIIFFISNFIFSGKSIYKKINIIYLFLFLPLLYQLIYSIFLNDVNSEMFTERMTSSASFDDRIGVYVNVLHVLEDKIYRIFFGFGADFLTASGDKIMSNQFKVNYYTKSMQGAVDSGIITFIIEFGILLFSFFGFILYRRIKYLFKTLNDLNILFIQIFFVFVISSTTQLVGLSKIFWFFAIIYSISKNSSKTITGTLKPTNT